MLRQLKKIAEYMKQIEKHEEERVECNHSEQNNKIEQTRLDNMKKDIKEIKEALKDTNRTWAQVLGYAILQGLSVISTKTSI